MIEPTVFQAFSEWVSQDFIVSAVAGGITWDIMKGNLWEPFKNKFLDYFRDEREAEKYFEEINTMKSINSKKPFRDIEDSYEEITNTSMPSNFIDELSKFLVDNKDKVEKMNQEKGDFSCLEQHAGRDINNVKGTQTIINIGK